MQLNRLRPAEFNGTFSYARSRTKSREIEAQSSSVLHRRV